MPPKGSTRRSARTVKTTTSSAQESKSSSSGSAQPTSPTGDTKSQKEEANEPPTKSRRGGAAAAKARAESHHVEEPKASSRATKHVHEPSPVDDTTKEDEDDEGGVTRCVCDEAEAETQDMGFMVQCESCNMWQHGMCMGIDREEDCPDQYFCHDCKPELHEDLIKMLEQRAKRRDSKKGKSISSSRTSRSTSPDARKSHHKSPKRRNTMNSRDPELEIVLDMSRKEAERAGILPEGDAEYADNGRRKRKRANVDPMDAAESASNARRKRSAGSPESTDPMNAEASSSRSKASKHTGGGPSASQESGAADATQLGRGRRSRKEKDTSQDADSAGKIKHPNQYTYRAPKPPTNSPSKRGGNGGNHEHGTRRNPPQARLPASSPSPVPLTYNIPDHFAHLAPLLPHPTPQGLNVRVGPGDDNRAMEKGVKVRWPPKRTTIGEMRRRVRGMMEYVARAQLEAGERERRVTMLKSVLRENQLAQPVIPVVTEELTQPPAIADAPKDDGNPTTYAGDDVIMSDATAEPRTKTEDSSDCPFAVTDLSTTDAATKGSRASSVGPKTVSSPSTSATSATVTSQASTNTVIQPTSSRQQQATSQQPAAQEKLASPTTTQLLDELTRELIQFQERFGAGREGKVYRERTDRERRTRGMVDIEMF